MKVGDKVKIRPDLGVGEKYGSIILLPAHMSKQRGKVGIISAEIYGDWYVLIDQDKAEFIWSEEMLELINEEN